MADIADVTADRMEVQEAADIAEIRRKANEIPKAFRAFATFAAKICRVLLTAFARLVATAISCRKGFEMTPETLAKSGSEAAHQTALFAWAARCRSNAGPNFVGCTIYPMAEAGATMPRQRAYPVRK